MSETCEFCGTGNYAHKQLTCKAELDALKAKNKQLLRSLAASRALVAEKDEALREAKSLFAALQAENEQLTVAFESLRQSLTQMQPNYEQAKAENERLRRVLNEIIGKLGHQANCNAYHINDAGKPCNCDIAEAVAILERKEA